MEIRSQPPAERLSATIRSHGTRSSPTTLLSLLILAQKLKCVILAEELELLAADFWRILAKIISLFLWYEMKSRFYWIKTEKACLLRLSKMDGFQSFWKEKESKLKSCSLELSTRNGIQVNSRKNNSLLNLLDRQCLGGTICCLYFYWPDETSRLGNYWTDSLPDQRKLRRILQKAFILKFYNKLNLFLCKNIKKNLLISFLILGTSSERRSHVSWRAFRF